MWWIRHWAALRVSLLLADKCKEAFCTRKISDYTHKLLVATFNQTGKYLFRRHWGNITKKTLTHLNIRRLSMAKHATQQITRDEIGIRGSLATTGGCKCSLCLFLLIYCIHSVLAFVTQTSPSADVIFDYTTAAQKRAKLREGEGHKMMQKISHHREQRVTSLLMWRWRTAVQRRRNQMRTTTLESIILSCQPRRKQIIWFMSLLPCFTSHVP